MQLKDQFIIAWKKPDKLDTIPANGPYEYLIYRAPELAEQTTNRLNPYKQLILMIQP